MADLMAAATGNLTGATTFALVDGTSYLNSESAVGTVTTSYVVSSTFTPGAITIDGIAIKVQARGSSGTISVALDQGGSTVSGTEVTINVADIDDDVAVGDPGWYFFKFAAPVLLVAATVYGVKVKTSVSSQLFLWTSATTNWSRALRTTTLQAPAAGDNMIIIGEHTGAGTGNSFVVTMDSTANTDYGAASTSLAAPAIAIGKRGTLKLGVAASTAYLLKVSGHIVVYSSGILNFLQSGDAFPTTSSFVLTMDCGSNVDFGITVRNGGTLYGDSNETKIVKTLLNTDEAAASTVIGLVSTSGWQVGDELGFAPTTQTNTQGEKKTIQTVDSSTQVTLTAGLTNAHSGTSPTQAEVVNLTRRIKIQGVSATVCTFLDIKATGVCTLRDIEFAFLGSATSLKRGIDVATTTGTFNVQRCAFRDCHASSVICNVSSASGSNITFSSNVAYSFGQMYVNAASTGVQTVDSNTCIGSLVVRTFFLLDAGSSYTNNVVAGSSSYGIQMDELGATLGTFSGNVVHSCGNLGFALNGFSGGTVLNCAAWRNASYGATFNYLFGSTFENMVFFGNAPNWAPILGSQAIGGGLVFKNCTFNGDTTFSVTSNLTFLWGCGIEATFISCDFSQAAGILTAATNDINITQASSTGIARLRLTFEYCRFGAANFFAAGSQLLMSDDSFVRVLSKNQTAGSDFWYDNVSTQTPDTVIYSTASPSLRILPIAATRRAQSHGLCPPMMMGMYYVAVASGGTASVSVKVRESAAGDAGGSTYNGQRARLIVLKNEAAGISADTVLATATGASAGAWETISGVTAAVSRDCVLEFVVDCGYTGWTTGWVNVDDWAG